jgi:hypothetical protein
MMVRAVRSGESLRSVGQRFGVSATTVLKWVRRCDGERSDRVDFEDRPRGTSRAWNRVSAKLEKRVLTIRQTLRERSVLGEYGARAIERRLIEQGTHEPPSIATISRILVRHGAVDAHARVRRPAPPPGWYLPAVAAGQAELDSFDLIEELKLEGGPQFSVLTAIALHGRQVDAWPARSIGAKTVVERLIQRWTELGLPRYAQFDNDTRFQGAHQFPDTVGRVSRLCLSLGVIPIFAPPLEHGCQNAIEAFNGLWQAKVWQRFHFADLKGLCAHCARYVQAHRRRNAGRQDGAPARCPLPKRWQLNLNAPLVGTLIYLRRCDTKGIVTLLGRRWQVDVHWKHRLVRCEVDFSAHRIACFALRRRDPSDQPLLAEFEYTPSSKTFQGAP